MSPLKHVLLPVLHCSDLDGNRSLAEPFLVYSKYLQSEELFGKPAGNPLKHDFAQEEEYKGCIPEGNLHSLTSEEYQLLVLKMVPGW